VADLAGERVFESLVTGNLFALTPAIRDLVNEIWRARRFRENWRIAEIIEAVRAAKEPGAIRDLLYLAWVNDSESRVSVQDALRELIRLVPVDLLPMLEDSLRRGWGATDYWVGLRAENLASLASASPGYADLLRLTTMHRDGYVRAEALRLLRDERFDETLPFLLLRCSDWVDEVRSLAEVAVRQHLVPEHADVFVVCLPLLERLLKSSRFSRDLWSAIRGLLCRSECGGALRRGFTSSSAGIRRWSFRLAAENASFAARELIDAGTADSDVLVRRWAFEFALASSPEDWRRVSGRAGKDSYGPIRRMAYESLAADPVLSFESVSSFLFDGSAALRRACQGLVAERFGVSSAEIYRAALRDGTRVTSVCVQGLAETGTPDDASMIAPLMSSRSARVRAAVIRALRALGRDQDLPLLEIVRSDVPSVTREAAFSVLRRREVPAMVVWQESLRNVDGLVWMGALKWMRIAGKWDQIQVYLDAAGRPDPGVRAFAVTRLKAWAAGYNRTFSQPNADEKASVQELFKGMRETVPVELARELEFVFRTMAG